MPSTALSQYLLYAAAALSGICVPGHTQMGFDEVFPALRALRPKGTASSKPAGDSNGVKSARIGWMEGNMVFGIMAILYTKWAHHGLHDPYEKAILAFVATYQVACGIAFARGGIYKPLLALWVVPGLAGVSQLV